MKNKIFIILAFALAWIGCDKREIPTYSGVHYIEFENKTVDSTIFSFVYYPNDEYFDFPVAVKLAGQAADRDLSYRIQVDEELTTAETKHYVLPEEMILHKGAFHDTCYVRLNKTEDLSDTKVKLVLRLESTQDLAIGKLENSVAIIQFSNTVDRPVWWDSNIETYYLGTYSDEKFTLFIKVTGADDLTGASNSEKRVHALKFKQYLIDHKGESETIEKNGQPMTVPVPGLE